MSGQVLDLHRFSGLLPRVQATSLPPDAAVVAENIDFGYGCLVSLKGDFKLRDLPMAAQSVFSEDGLRFYAWPSDVDAVVSPYQNGPARDRLYYTTGTDFRVTSLSGATTAGTQPSMGFRVGVPRPSRPPRVTVVHPSAPSGPPVIVEALPAETYADRLTAAQAIQTANNAANTFTSTETRAYAYTYANNYNEEGAPSDAAVVEIKAITSYGVTTYSTVQVEVSFDDYGQYAPIGTARLYRTANGGAGENYFYTMDVPYANGSATVSDTVEAKDLNDTLASLDAYPPDPTLRGLMNMGNGILCAWKGRELWFSDPYRPWSWPPKYMKTTDFPIVGSLVHGTGALITTAAAPTFLSGVTPDAMSQMPIDTNQAGVSKWAMLSFDGKLFYATAEGIMTVVGGTPSMTLSDRYFTRPVWRARCGGAAGLASMQFAYHDGRLVVFSKSNKFVAFMLELEEGKGAMTDLPQLVASTAVVLPTTDQMYTVSGTALYQFGGGADLPLRWRGGDMVLDGPLTLAAAQIECTGDFTIKFYQKGVLGYTVTVATGTTTISLPSERGYQEHLGLRRSDRWQFEISGAGTFKWLKAAPSKRQLKGV